MAAVNHQQLLLTHPSAHTSLALEHLHLQLQHEDDHIQAQQLPLPPRFYFPAVPQIDPQNSPIDFFLEHLLPLHIVHKACQLNFLNQDLVIEAKLVADNEFTFLYVGVHSTILSLFPEFGLEEPQILPGQVRKLVQKHEPTYAVLISLLRWFYTNTNIVVTPHCHISCAQDFVDLHQFARSHSITNLQSALEKTNLYFSADRSIHRPLTNIQHGFDIDLAEQDLTPVFVDTLSFPYRKPSIFQNGLYIIQDSPVFVQDVSQVVMPRTNSRCGGKCYRLLVPLEEKAKACYGLLRFLQELTLNAKVDADIITARHHQEEIVAGSVELVQLGFTVDGGTGDSSTTAEHFVEAARRYLVEIRCELHQNGSIMGQHFICFRGYFDRMFRFATHLQNHIAGIVLHWNLINLTIRHFESLFAAAPSLVYSPSINSFYFSGDIACLLHMLRLIHEHRTQDLHFGQARIIIESDGISISTDD